MSRVQIIKEMLADEDFKMILIKKLYGEEDDQAGVLAANPGPHLEKDLKALSEQEFEELKLQFTNISSVMARRVCEGDDGDKDGIPENSETPEIKSEQGLELEQNNNLAVLEEPETVSDEINAIYQDRSSLSPGNGPLNTPSPDPTNEEDHESLSESGEDDELSVSPGRDCPADHVQQEDRLSNESDDNDPNAILSPLVASPEPPGRYPVQESWNFNEVSNHGPSQRRCQPHQCVPAEIKCQHCQYPMDVPLINEVFKENAKFRRERNELERQLSEAQDQIVELQLSQEITQYRYENVSRIMWQFHETLQERKRNIDSLRQELTELSNEHEIQKNRCEANETSYQRRIKDLEALPKANLQFIEHLLKRNEDLQDENKILLERIETMKDEASRQEKVYMEQLFYIQTRIDEEDKKLRQAYKEMQTFSACHRLK
ncbi:uncharacterized protein LOC110239063 [Exaiptasia diaphana]|uniref:Uncharacterized protein n=1 Tax=Exaiptasia diaphana TaxID=2652724 RepID=A0A913X802_EXADI|nr:uncharacterized protein LOC110239063 [Exaiptasia diaphana]XP_020900425.1 uncharacterized protein LOC110239063 [Exaiptasia diaphana]XP_020900426.1 uncharacterized protein LOC110239063 [Exaiptasia diaphana]KXJ14296.1 hypothetical protein AC249_AIPGENE5965 [Exaiptasia diaphana]